MLSNSFNYFQCPINKTTASLYFYWFEKAFSAHNKKTFCQGLLITNKQYLLHHKSLSITEYDKGIKTAVSTQL